MFYNMSDIRQSQIDRLEDAGVIKFGDRINSIPKVQKGTMRSRVLQQVRQVLHNNDR
jgi:hypothetical protein